MLHFIMMVPLKVVLVVFMMVPHHISYTSMWFHLMSFLSLSRGPTARVHMQKYGPENEVVNIDAGEKVVTLENGRKIKYDALVSTLPLDFTLTWLGKPEWAAGLSRRSVPLAMCGERGGGREGGREGVG